MELPILQIAPFDLVESLLYVAGTVLAIILLALSITAYRNIHLKKLLYAFAAFSLFGIFLFYEYLETTLPVDNPFSDILLPSIVLTILVFFFLAVVTKK